MTKLRIKGWRSTSAPGVTLSNFTDNEQDAGQVLSVRDGAMHASTKSSLVKMTGADRRFFMIAPVLASLWLTSCITPQGDRSTKLNSASTATSRNIGGDGGQGAGSETGSAFAVGNRSVADAGGQGDGFGSFGRRVALVIGNSDYSNDIGRLANPSRDAFRHCRRAGEHRVRSQSLAGRQSRTDDEGGS